MPTTRCFAKLSFGLSGKLSLRRVAKTTAFKSHFHFPGTVTFCHSLSIHRLSLAFCLTDVQKSHLFQQIIHYCGHQNARLFRICINFNIPSPNFLLSIIVPAENIRVCFWFFLKRKSTLGLWLSTLFGPYNMQTQWCKEAAVILHWMWMIWAHTLSCFMQMREVS